MEKPVPTYVVQEADGAWRVANSGVSLDCIAQAYWQGQTAEAILEDFPSLNLEQIYGAIAFYLHNRQEIDRSMRVLDALWDETRRESEAGNASLLNRLRERRRQVPMQRF